MSLFVCEKCGVIENTALGRYWTKDMPDLWDPDNFGKALCSECAPTTFKDGEPVGSDRYGKWHGHFEKRYYKDLSEKERKELINYDKDEFKKFE